MRARAKLCPRCGSEGPFYKNRSRADGMDSYCTACRKLADRVWHELHRDELRARKLAYDVRRRAAA